MSSPPSTSNCSCGDGLCTDCARDMRRAILNVRQLHRPVKPHPRGLDVCQACSDLKRHRNPISGRTTTDDHRAGVAAPCATIRVLDDAGV